MHRHPHAGQLHAIGDQAVHRGRQGKSEQPETHNPVRQRHRTRRAARQRRLPVNPAGQQHLQRGQAERHGGQHRLKRDRGHVLAPEQAERRVDRVDRPVMCSATATAAASRRCLPATSRPAFHPACLVPSCPPRQSNCGSLSRLTYRSHGLAKLTGRAAGRWRKWSRPEAARSEAEQVKALRSASVCSALFPFPVGLRGRLGRQHAQRARSRFGALRGWRQADMSKYSYLSATGPPGPGAVRR
jgi:hypothetical protein